MPRQLGASRFDEDELGATLGRVLDPGRGDGMIDHGIGADKQHHFRLQDIHHGIRYCARADALQQRSDARRMAQSCAVVDVVRSEAGAHELLE